MVHVEPLVDFLDLALALGLIALGFSFLAISATIYFCHLRKGGK